jgi:hypothetical protein
MDQLTKDILTIIIDSLVAIGTLLLAVLAIFGDKIRRIFYKPKIEIEIKGEPPFIETNSNESSSVSLPSTETYIRIKVNNNGTLIATKCQAIIEAIWCKRQGNETYYKQRALSPSLFTWNNNSTELSINPNIPAYLEICRLLVDQIKTSETEPKQDNKENKCSLFLSIPEPDKRGSFIRLGFGTFILPVIIYADNLKKYEKYYFEIFWNGSKVDDLSKSGFYVKRLTGKDLPDGIN